MVKDEGKVSKDILEVSLASERFPDDALNFCYRFVQLFNYFVKVFFSIL